MSQQGYPGHGHVAKQQAPPQYAALSEQEDASPPMYAIAIEMPVAPVQENRFFSTGICDCLGHCSTCMQTWCLPWITLAQISHKIRYTSFNKVICLWASLSVLWMAVYFGGNHMARNEIRACIGNHEHADKIADKHLLSASFMNFGLPEGTGSAEHHKHHKHHDHHTGSKKEHLRQGSGSGSGSGSENAPPAQFNIYQCPAAIRVLKVQDLLNSFIRLVTYVAFVVIAAGVRHKTRRHYALEGSDCQDICFSMFCNCCVLAQLARELKSNEEGCFVKPTPVSDISVAPVLSAQVVPVGQQV